MRALLWSFLAVSVASIAQADEPFPYLEMCRAGATGPCRVVFVGATRAEALTRVRAAEPKGFEKIAIAYPERPEMLEKLSQLAASVSYDVVEDPLGRKRTHVGLSGTHFSSVVTGLWRVEALRAAGGLAWDTTALVQGTFAKSMRELGGDAVGGLTWNITWRTHGARVGDSGIDQTSLKPEDRGATAVRRTFDWTVGFGLGYAIIVGGAKINLHAGLFHEARGSSIRLEDKADVGPDGRYSGSTYDFQDFSENRNGVITGISVSGRRFVLAGDVNFNLGRRSYLIMGDYDNDGAYDYDHDGVEEDDYEYGFFPKEGVRPVGYVYAQYQVANHPRSPWVGVEVANIGHRVERLDFKEFQTPLAAGPQVKLRVLIPLGGRKSAKKMGP